MILDYLATRRFKKAIAESLIAALLLAALTAVCLRLRLNLATASLRFVIVIVLLARVAEFVSSIVAAVFARDGMRQHGLFRYFGEMLPCGLGFM